jgi:hypothetical protein
MQSLYVRLKRKFSNVKISERLISNTLNNFQPFITEFPLQRFGGKADGSYLIPVDLDGIDNCISFGCGSDTKFEDDLGNYIGSSFTIFDEIENFPVNFENSKHSFVLGWIAKFRKPKSSATPLFTVDSAVRHSSESEFSDAILKIDIEGSEYTALLAADTELLKRVRILIVEFHRVNEITSSSIFCLLLDELVKKLLDTFLVVHFHPNNAVKPFKFGRHKFPSCFEVTFLRKDRARVSEKAIGPYEHPLDVLNSDSKSQIVVSFPVGTVA